MINQRYENLQKVEDLGEREVADQDGVEAEGYEDAAGHVAERGFVLRQGPEFSLQEVG